LPAGKYALGGTANDSGNDGQRPWWHRAVNPTRDLTITLETRAVGPTGLCFSLPPVATHAITP